MYTCCLTVLNVIDRVLVLATSAQRYGCIRIYEVRDTQRARIILMCILDGATV